MNNYDENDLINAIKNSGYLLESEIVKYLSENDFFVESNQSILDPITNKNREIDIIAEKFITSPERHKKLLVSFKFVFEIKNNIFPLVLMTQLPFSPNVMLFEDLKIYSSIKSDNDSYYNLNCFEKLSTDLEKNAFTQYCSFSKKKNKDTNNQLMACHPDNLYSGFSKITQYCDEWIDIFESQESYKYNRFWLWNPILLVNKDLYELHIQDKDDPKLYKVEESKLIFNYYYKGVQYNSLIYVVTKSGLDSFMRKMLNLQDEFLNEISMKLNEED